MATNTKQRVVVGCEVYAALEAEKERIVPHSKRPGMEQYFESEPLCAWQRDCHRRGFRSVELVKSIYGWSVRSASGLDDFALLAGSRNGELDSTFADAQRYAQEWAAQDKERRYAFVRSVGEDA